MSNTMRDMNVYGSGEYDGEANEYEHMEDLTKFHSTGVCEHRMYVRYGVFNDLELASCAVCGAASPNAFAKEKSR